LFLPRRSADTGAGKENDEAVGNPALLMIRLSQSEKLG
jgi:hypothetical protein